MTATRPPMLAADYLRELVRPYLTSESVTQPTEGDDGKWRTTRRLHTVHHASLLTQLNAAITGASSLSDEDAGRSTFGSKPAARLEAMAVIAMIDSESLDLAIDLDLEQPPRTKTKVKHLPIVDRLLAISGQIGASEHPAPKRWWTAARITTQWESRPFHPKGAPCPQCWETSSLRVVLSEELARCTECGFSWDDNAFRVLAQHVKWCTDHEVTKPRHWNIDEHTTELVECTECLPFRDAYTDWKTSKATAHTAVTLHNMTRHAEGN